MKINTHTEKKESTISIKKFFNFIIILVKSYFYFYFSLLRKIDQSASINYFGYDLWKWFYFVLFTSR